MLAKINSYGLRGIAGYAVDLEIDINSGLPGVEIVGLANAAIKESKERIRSAVKNSGFSFSPKKITVNLAPADIKKEGTHFDLGIALGILCATEQLSPLGLKDIVVLGELSLDGGLRPVRGLLPMLIDAKAAGVNIFIVPFENAVEAARIDGIEVYAVKDLSEAAAVVSNRAAFSPVPYAPVLLSDRRSQREDFKYIKGQYMAKRALEIAAAGGHNAIMIGPPGAGKTMMARAVPSILPDLSAEEALETTKIYSVAGLLDPKVGIVRLRPFRSPHHSATATALAGGTSSVRPGEMSLAHNGVLFLDELPEYTRASLENLRQPLEDGVITISRAERTVEFPASFMLIASMNPCPCGYYGSSDRECKCSPIMIQKYMNKLSGPLLDRIDLHLTVSSVEYDELNADTYAESSEAIRARVNAAREIQLKRYAGTGIYSNAKMDSAMIKAHCVLDDEGNRVLKTAFNQFKLSARSYHKLLKTARTIADLAASPQITAAHIKEAILYRRLDREKY